MEATFAIQQALEGVSRNDQSSIKLVNLLDSAKDPLSLPTLGIRLSILETLIEDWGGRGMLDELSTHSLVRQFIKPLTERSQLPFTAKLLQSHDALKIDSVHESNWFISHSHASRFLDTVDALYSFFDGRGLLDRHSIVIWMDVFSISQHVNSSTRPSDWWASVFMKSVKQIENVVLVVSDWEDELELKRSWCLFELYCCIQTGSSFYIAMGPEATDTFHNIVKSSPSDFHDLLSSLSIESSSALLESDKAVILQTIQTNITLREMDRQILVLVSHWILAHIEYYLKHEQDSLRRATYQLALGTLHHQMGTMELSIPYLLECHEAFKSSGIAETDNRVVAVCQLLDPKKAVESSFQLAVKAFQDRNYTIAETLFLKTIQFGEGGVESETGESEPIDFVVESAKYLKDIYKSQGNATLSKKYENKLHLLALYKRQLVVGSPDYALQKAEIAAKHHTKVSEWDDAIKSYLGLLDAQKKALGQFDPVVVDTLKSIAEILTKMGTPNVAVKFTVEMYFRLGMGHQEANEMDKAERMYLRAFDFDATVEFGPDDTDYVIESVKCLVALYKAQDRPRMVKKYEDLLKSALGA
ncbi:hypothetical protein BDR26DRAFT_922011 [Obelidium mucronatum]|nr:hypothetical protein BDR26DRAFT_922011 [Obelidium mucronatum]